LLSEQINCRNTESAWQLTFLNLLFLFYPVHSNHSNAHWNYQKIFLFCKLLIHLRLPLTKSYMLALPLWWSFNLPNHCAVCRTHSIISASQHARQPPMIHYQSLYLPIINMYLFLSYKMGNFGVFYYFFERFFFIV
jgi:hypothetical protein